MGAQNFTLGATSLDNLTNCGCCGDTPGASASGSGSGQVAEEIGTETLCCPGVLIANSLTATISSTAGLLNGVQVPLTIGGSESHPTAWGWDGLICGSGWDIWMECVFDSGLDGYTWLMHVDGWAGTDEEDCVSASSTNALTTACDPLQFVFTEFEIGSWEFNCSCGTSGNTYSVTVTL
jgi:hypothetical protein